MLLLTLSLLLNNGLTRSLRRIVSWGCHELFIGPQRSRRYTEWRRQTFFLGVLLLRLSRSRRSFMISLVLLILSYVVDWAAKRTNLDGGFRDTTVVSPFS